MREPGDTSDEDFGRLVGKSRAMQQVYRLIELLRDSTATVATNGSLQAISAV